ncbi:hypothetical protein KXR83_06865 [Williamsia muralis]|uniref:hypothetical protein n=1 Tax=Williamsia marianensis TaxID=85044 RepID=UPI003F135899
MADLRARGEFVGRKDRRQHHGRVGLAGISPPNFSPPPTIVDLHPTFPPDLSTVSSARAAPTGVDIGHHVSDLRR